MQFLVRFLVIFYFTRKYYKRILSFSIILVIFDYHNFIFTSGAASNNILNENSDLLLKEIKPALESELEKVFLQIGNKITSTFTYDELFPDN